MDEVDKIIFHSLRQIGCNIDAEVCSMANFTPKLLVHAVACCLREIRPNNAIPHSLPENMAQRFTVASTLAEICTAIGYRTDIGYQTFLYPNAVEVRRLFMFLIEQLPKDNRDAQEPEGHGGPLGKYEVLRAEIKQKMLNQLQTPWMPQYARLVSHKRHISARIQSVPFSPQLNLNILGVAANAKEVQVYLQQQAPSVFQQTAGADFDLIASVLHKNAMDRHSVDTSSEMRKIPLSATGRSRAKSSNNAASPSTTTTETSESATVLTPLEKLTEDVNLLKCQNDSLIAERKSTSVKINTFKSQQLAIQNEIEQLRNDAKIHERTCVVLENPAENVTKLEGLIQTAQERRATLKQQWEAYREPLVENLKALQTAKQTKNLQSVMDMRTLIVQLEQTLQEKTAQHAQLAVELKNCPQNAAPRIEYTRRIMEFIRNIRKQRNDIFKVLDDTRDLQKQLNSVSAQLQRQFNYTDDLLFQSAKHDVHAKKAYKLLALLHATCNDLVELVSQTGNLTKEIRDLEEQIEREKLKNITVNLKQISADIKNFENVIKNIQTEIRKVENEITAG